MRRHRAQIALLLAAWLAFTAAPALAQSTGGGAGGSGTVTSVACPSVTITTTGTCNPVAAAGTSGDLVTADGAHGVADSGTLLSAIKQVPANLTLTNPASGSTLTLAAGKTVTVSNTLTLAGTDSTTMTFPATSATIARTDAAQTFTGTQTFGGVLMSSGSTLTLNSAAVAKASAITLSGCGTGAGSISGPTSLASGFAVGTSPPTTCTITFPATASHGWKCVADDLTTPTEVIHQTGVSTTTCVITYYAITTGIATAPTASDVINFLALGY